MSRKSSVVLVDFSNISHACWHPALAAEEAGQKALEDHKSKCVVCEMGDPCQSKPRLYYAKEVLKKNLDLKIQTISQFVVPPIKSWIFVKDGHDTHRKVLLPSYKGNRDHTKFDPRPLAEAHIRTKGCRFAISSDSEADDAIATYTRDLVEAGIDVIIVSGDADLWQLFNPPKVRIFLTTKNEWLDEYRIEKKLRITDPKHVRLVKSLWGDSSDNIPNLVPRMQKHLIPLIHDGDGTLENLIDQLRTNQVSRTCSDLFFGNLGAIRVNYEVVGLRDNCVVNVI